MTNINTACVYCASRMGNNPNFEKAAKEFGKILAENNITMVYGGSVVGLMGATANSVLENGGKVIGIIPEIIEKQGETKHEGLTEQYCVKDMHERKKMMADKSDAFIILPGGFGTMDETFEILTWKTINIHNKPIIFVNIDGFYDPLLKLIDHFVENGVTGEGYRDAFVIVDRVEDVMTKIKEM